ncbi:uncharacterized protein N7498_010912 [Penicillium cinerascens]|uniref:DUF1996 domain-containing protein n=1 Tax=Penicillium cinerascens TaxID=70096 RepID=A0A9W9J8K9_9EURO|nr:uncharacterized protein N7498_010912 [Penicillium cinerascens]KAJ5191927.1 hypothetical protein N7498_010912 [Penicillium cinerascens]
MQDIRLTTVLGACLTIFPVFTNAFWRLPCRGRTGVARLDPIVDPGMISGHVHTVHGAGNFGMSADTETLLESSCTSCAVEQDMSAYWTPALYFMHTNGSAELVEEVGGMLAYYLLYGESVTAFPDNFRMLAGDSLQRNFTWPIPDPPKSSWSGAQESQAALRQKAIGFNCLNYAKDPEPSLYRHFMPNKTYLDEHCTDGIRIELMFPSCWNGKDVDSEDHKSHVAYPSVVMDGTCPEGYETRLVSLFYETIWNTYAFQDRDGYFAIANGDPTGFGYHGDFMYGWEDGVLQQAVDTCTSETGLVGDCEIFRLQSEKKQRKCSFDIPSGLRHENVYMHASGLPGDLLIQWGPEYATMTMPSDSDSATTALPPGMSIPSILLPSLSLSPTISIGNMVGNIDDFGTQEAAAATTVFSTTTSTSNPTPIPTTSIEVDSITEEVVYLEQDVVVKVDGNGTPYATSTGTLRTLSSTTITATSTSTAVSYVERDMPTEPERREYIAEHARRHIHHHRHLHKRF